MGGTLTKVYLNHNRGWASPDAARSITRIDRQLGRPADINEAGRSPEQADANHRAWLAYLNGGPKAPYALPASQSIHCQGDAADTDDWYNDAAAAVWYDNGWRQTARYPNNPKKDEPWHGEYFPDLDNHRHEVVELVNENGTWRIAPDKEWDEMATEAQIRAIVADETKKAAVAAVKQYARGGAYKIVGVKGPASNPGPHMKLVGPEGEAELTTPDEVRLVRRHVQATPYVADQPWNPKSPFVSGEELFTATEWAIVSKVLARMRPAR